MNTAALIKHYNNPSLHICIVEAKERIENLEAKFKRGCGNLKPQYIQDEIHYYESAIFRAQQIYKDDSQSLYGYSLRPRTPSISSISDSEEEAHPVSEKNDELEDKINRIEEVVYQLIGGLFNHETQFGIIDSHNACLFGRKPSSSIDNQSVYPTTRQGDANEEEIRLLKQQVSKLEGTVNVLIQLLQKK
jgi:hypothetical protein